MCLSGVLEIKSVDVGIVAIKGLSSNFYLAISKKGELYGAVSLACTEILTQNNNIPTKTGANYLAEYTNSPLD